MFTKNKTLSFLITLFIIAGLVLSIVSGMNLCKTDCVAAHQYRFFGLPFEWIGVAYFMTLLSVHLLSYKFNFISYLTGLMLAGGVGSEIRFIYVQKYQIGQWCPICLSIAGTVFIAFILYAIEFIKDFKASNELRRSDFMNGLYKGLSTFIAVFLGFAAAYVGVIKENQLQAVENNIKENIVFGNKQSPVEVFLFTDWACPACRSLEPALEKMIPAIQKEAQLTYVDFVIHAETLNYTPYNLAFMVHNKDKYLTLRKDLSELSEKNDTPQDEDIKKIAKDNGVELKELSYADVMMATKYFSHLGKEFGIKSTPTLVIVNKSTKKGKRLQGANEITEENVLKTIEMLKKD